MDLILFHFGIAVILFVVINWIGAHAQGFGYLPLGVLAVPDEAPAFNVLFRVVGPVVGIVLLAAALQAFRFERFTEGIWLISVYYVLFRLVFNVARGRRLLLNWTSQLGTAGATILLAYWTYDAMLRDRRSILPDFGTFTNELWLLVILFLFHVANGLRISDKATRKRKRRYLAATLKQVRPAIW